MATAHFSGHLIVTGGCSNTSNLIGSDCHPNAGAAEQNPPVSQVVANLIGHAGRHIWVIDRIRAVGAAVDDFVAKPFQQSNQAETGFDASMITPYCDPHAIPFPDATDCSHLPQHQDVESTPAAGQDRVLRVWPRDDRGFAERTRDTPATARQSDRARHGDPGRAPRPAPPPQETAR